jgi:transposase InsO family protein
MFLKLSAILDSGASLHVFNDLSRFSNFRKAPRGDYLLAGASEVPILGYGHVDLQITKQNGTKGILRLKDVAFCPDFVTNIVSFRLLRAKGIHWNTITNILFRESDSTLVCTLKETDGQQVIENSPEQQATALATSRVRRRRKATSRQPRPASKGDGALWHARMGHPGPMSLHKLGANSLGVALRGPSTTECEFCSQAKIRRQISRRPPDRNITKPCQEIHIDWTDLETAYEGFVRVMFITDRYSGMVFPYFISTYGEEKENLRVLKDFVNWMSQRFGLKVQVIRSDNELSRKKTLRWLRSQGIEFEPSAPRTQDQNGVAERSGGVIIEKSRAMRISANLPHDLWKEVVNCAVYLHNRTPRESQAWKTPYEVFFSYIDANQSTKGIQKKPQLAHLKTYDCRAYAMTEDAQLK